MSEQEKNGLNSEGSTFVVVETASEQHKLPYRPTEVEDDPLDSQQKRSRAPAVPSMMAEDLKLSEEPNSTATILNEMSKHSTAKKVSSISYKRRETQPETMNLTNIETRKMQPQPIPPELGLVSPLPVPDKEVQQEDTKREEDKSDLRTVPVEPPTPAKYSEWSDEEEAGGLPRSDSRVSRVSRAVRQLFCCGVPYEAPSEDNISSHRGYAL